MLNLEQELKFSVNCSYFHNYSHISCCGKNIVKDYLSLSCYFHSTWYSALVGLVSRVSPDVLLEM